MTLSLYNSLTRKKSTFVPGDPNRVTLYVCGPTVYNYAHIGNFRPVVVFDVLHRLLRYQYGPENVVFARNITDIDDKIIRAARENNEPISGVTQRFAQIYREESSALNCLPPTIEPHATDHIAEMQGLITDLMATGAAYAAEGHVLFDIEACKNYGALSGVNRDEMIAGARVEVAPFKRNPADFVLWKPAKAGEPGWDAPGQWDIDEPGRPGWHLECSAMIAATLGETIDIHGGGQDLKFPHHENEIAQSECAHGAPLARVWMHNGFVNMGADKMSKSLGNVLLLKDILASWPGEVVRWALLSAHYRQPLDWSDALLEQSRRQLDRFYRVLMEHKPDDSRSDDGDPDPDVLDALNDDLNTPGAVAALHALRERIQTAPSEEKSTLARQLHRSGALFGFFQQDTADWFQGGVEDHSEGIDPAAIEALIAERAAAKKARDFTRADAIRDALNADGIQIEDGPKGTTWRRA